MKKLKEHQKLKKGEPRFVDEKQVGETKFTLPKTALDKKLPPPKKEAW